MRTIATNVILFILLAGLIGFNVLVYNFCERQKAQMDELSRQQQSQAQEAGKQFQYEHKQVQRLSQQLEDAGMQLKDQQNAIAQQRDALQQEAQKREDIQADEKNIQSSLIDIKAEADAIKEQMKAWQKDYVTVLAQLSKKMDDTQIQIKDMDDTFKQDMEDLKARMGQALQPKDGGESGSETSAVPKDNAQLPADYSPMDNPQANSEAVL